MIHLKEKIAYQELKMDAFMERYHFDTKDRMLVASVAQFLCEMVEVESFIQEEQDGVLCAVTLGKRYDALEDLVTESGNLLLSYCMECMGMELLSKGYARMNEAVYRQKGKWLSRYQFLEDEQIQAYGGGSCGDQESIAFGDVEWRQGMLHPLKSVVFRAQYRAKRESESCHDCADCGNLLCSFRRQMIVKEDRYTKVLSARRKAQSYSYGISAVFGGNQEDDTDVFR